MVKSLDEFAKEIEIVQDVFYRKLIGCDRLWFRHEFDRDVQKFLLVMRVFDVIQKSDKDYFLCVKPLRMKEIRKLYSGDSNNMGILSNCGKNEIYTFNLEPLYAFYHCNNCDDSKCLHVFENNNDLPLEIRSIVEVGLYNELIHSGVYKLISSTFK